MNKKRQADRQSYRAIPMSRIELPTPASVREAPLLLRAQELARLLSIFIRTLWQVHCARSLPQPMRLGAAGRCRKRNLFVSTLSARHTADWVDASTILGRVRYSKPIYCERVRIPHAHS